MFEAARTSDPASNGLPATTARPARRFAQDVVKLSPATPIALSCSIIAAPVKPGGLFALYGVGDERSLRQSDACKLRRSSGQDLRRGHRARAGIPESDCAPRPERRRTGAAPIADRTLSLITAAVTGRALMLEGAAGASRRARPAPAGAAPRRTRAACILDRITALDFVTPRARPALTRSTSQ